MLLANGLTTFPIKGNPFFRNDPKSLPKNLSDFPILYNWIFGNFTYADEPFGKALRSFKTSVLLVMTYVENYFHR